MKMDLGRFAVLAAAALAACASAGENGMPHIAIAPPDITCSTGRLAGSPVADSAAATLALIPVSQDAPTQYAAARAQAGRVIAADPGNAYGYYLAGQAAVGMADYAAADTMFRRAVELCPELAGYDVDRLRRGSASLAAERGNTLLQAADTAGAIAAYQTSLRLDPNNYAAEFYLGLVAFQRQNTGEAVRYWRRVIQTIDKLPPDTAPDVNQARLEARSNTLNALTLTAAQYLNLQQPAPAAELLADLTQWQPNNSDAWYNYALALNNLQRWPQLAPVARRATEISPLNFGAWVLYYNAFAGQAQAATQAGQTAQASEFVRQAREISQRSESLPLQIEGLTLDTNDANTVIRGTAVGTGATNPVQVEFTLHGTNTVLGRGTVSIMPPARDQRAHFELNIRNTAPVLGITYRVVGG